VGEPSPSSFWGEVMPSSVSLPGNPRLVVDGSYGGVADSSTSVPFVRFFPLLRGPSSPWGASLPRVGFPSFSPASVANGGTSNHPRLRHSTKIRSIKARSERPSKVVTPCNVSSRRRRNRGMKTSFSLCARCAFVQRESITQMTAER
jgi:hypothetical protein